MNMLRKMQASFSWDWGPAVPSIGIWKPVELELTNAAIIRDVVIDMELIDNIWNLRLWIHFENLGPTTVGVISAKVL